MSNSVVLTEFSFIDVQHFLENLIEILGGKSPLEWNEVTFCIFIVLTCILPTLFHMKRFIDNTTIWCITAVFPKAPWLMLALLLKKKKKLSFSSDHCRSVLEKAGHSASCSFTRGWATKLSLCPPGCCFLTASGSCHPCLLFSVVAGPGDASFTSGMAKIFLNGQVILS